MNSDHFGDNMDKFVDLHLPQKAANSTWKESG